MTAQELGRQPREFHQKRGYLYLSRKLVPQERQRIPGFENVLRRQHWEARETSLLPLLSLMPSALPTPYAGGAMLQSSLPQALSLEELLEVGEAVQWLEHLLLLQQTQDRFLT